MESEKAKMEKRKGCSENPPWHRFCEETMVKTEDGILARIAEGRIKLDSASRNMPIHTWHFSITLDSRNYLVYSMLDTVLGLARHGEQLEKVVKRDEFRQLLDFIMEQEHDAFIKADNKRDYFSSLANQVLRLSPLVEQPATEHTEEELEALSDDIIPTDPVDTLFQYYESEEAIQEQPSANDTLTILLKRVERARKDDATHGKPDLTAMQVLKECHENLRRFEKRLEKLASAVKAITQQMLQNPEEGECQVVVLFQRNIFFVAPPESMDVVEKFLALQKSLAQQYESQDRADAEACFKCSDFVPLVKEATCMPESLLSHIEESCKRYGNLDEHAEPKKVEESAEAKESGKDDGAEEGERKGTAKEGSSEGEVVLECIEPQPTSAEMDTQEVRTASEPGERIDGLAELKSDKSKSDSGEKSPQKPISTEKGGKSPKEERLPEQDQKSAKQDKLPEDSEKLPKQDEKSPKQEKSPKEPEKILEDQKSPRQDEKTQDEKSAKQDKSPKRNGELSKESENPPKQPEILPDSVEPKPGDSSTTKPESASEADSPDTGSDKMGEKVSLFDRYFKNIHMEDVKGIASRCIFSIKNADLDTADYLCPVLGYLPLLPLMEIMYTKPRPTPRA